MYKPLLIEALVKYVGQTSLGIDDAMNNLFKKSNEELRAKAGFRVAI